MAHVRIRFKVVIAFICLCLCLLYLGLAHLSFSHDKLLHGFGFFLFTSLLYWTIDIPRQLALVLTGTCSFGAAIFSEYLQAAVSSRVFDGHDIVANCIGSSAALVLNGLFHNILSQSSQLGAYTPVQTTSQDEELASLPSVV